jgi:hypothetical protein
MTRRSLPYRDDLATLEARREELRRDITEADRRIADLAGAAAEKEKLTRELAAVEAGLERARLPLLDAVGARRKRRKRAVVATGGAVAMAAAATMAYVHLSRLPAPLWTPMPIPVVPAPPEFCDRGEPNPEPVCKANVGAPCTCTPNVGAACTSNRDCAQCADVLAHLGPCTVRVTTAVECVDAVCKRTGCPTDPCPNGTVCEGCFANIPCQCR